ncbi:Panacea domain-containing protein [Bartonella sp. B30(2025)]
MGKTQKNNDGICTVQEIANFFLDKGYEENIAISPMKLLKLVYFAYGWVLAITDKRLFSDPIEAWEYGPVVRDLYHEFKCWGKDPISRRSQTSDLRTGGTVIPRILKEKCDRNIIKILDKVWDVYKDFTAIQLSEETHKKETPWYNTYRIKKLINERLNDDEIKEYFKSNTKSQENDR